MLTNIDLEKMNHLMETNKDARTMTLLLLQLHMRSVIL